MADVGITSRSAFSDPARAGPTMPVRSRGPAQGRRSDSAASPACPGLPRQARAARGIQEGERQPSWRMPEDGFSARCRASGGGKREKSRCRQATTDR